MFENKRLIKLTNSNDEIDQVIQKNYMSIYKYCYYHVGNSNAAQDITQEVFLKFLKHIDRYKEYGKLRNYLYVIAKNCIRDYLRKAKQVNLETVIEGFDSGGIDRKLEQLNIWEAINSLEEIEKEIIILRYYQDFRIKDISQVMGIPASTARYKLKNAEKKFKEKIGDIKMFQKRLKKELNKIEVPAYDTHKYKETIAKAKKIKLHPENLRMSSTEFFCDQLRFIKTETWILKIIVSALVLYLLITEQINISSWFWTLIAISGPILCLINAKELCNVFQPGMLEIQITAKNSFSKVLMVRLTIFGLFDLLFFMTMALGISMLKQTVIWQVILYGIVPYIIMCFGCMLILNRSREENIPLYSGAWGACLSCIITILKISDVKIFQTSYLGIWIGIGLIALLGMMIEMRKLLKRAGGNLNEISYGTPF